MADLAPLPLSSLPSSAPPSVSSPPPSTHIFKLNLNCLHEIFDLLSLHALIAIGKTCKLMQRAAGEFFRHKYIATKITYDNFYYNPYREISVFAEYIPRIYLTSKASQFVHFIASNFKSLEHIRLDGSLSDNLIENLTGVLHRIRYLDIVESPNRNEFHDFLLQHCQHLESLSVKKCGKIAKRIGSTKSIVIGCDNDWMLRSYPTLKHFELTEVYEFKQSELITFFHRNPNVRTFSTDSYSLWENRHSFLNTDARLERLAIEFISENLADNVISLLNELYERGFYKRLHIYPTEISIEYLKRIISLPFSDAIEYLRVDFWQIDTVLWNLKVLEIDIRLSVSMPTTNFPEKFPNLERMYLNVATTEQLLPFIQRSSRLKMIKIADLIDHMYLRHGFVDVMALNDEREKLKTASKIVIYIDEPMVLATKWANEPIACNLIELRRFGSVEWNELNTDFRNCHRWNWLEFTYDFMK